MGNRDRAMTSENQIKNWSVVLNGHTHRVRLVGIYSREEVQVAAERVVASEGSLTSMAVQLYLDREPSC